MKFFWNTRRSSSRSDIREIDPDEILIDSENLPQFNVHQFEGRLETPVPRRSLLSLALIFAAILCIFIYRVYELQVVRGKAYAEISENNRLRHTILFADRGVITDRNGVLLAWNDPVPNGDFARRAYTERSGFAHVLGYTASPKKDKHGYYYQEEFVGHEGVEEYYSDRLDGENGLTITETDVAGRIVSESLQTPPRAGEELALSLDADIQEAFQKAIQSLSEKVGFAGGAGILMDLNTGELLALTSYPEHRPQVLADGVDTEAIASYVKDSRSPFLNRAVNPYTPGSIIKPFLALGALTEGIISPEKQILSTGSISVANPYTPEEPSIFLDWKAHGYVDMRKAIAVSSNVYFYTIGGGFEGQRGLGIANIKKYAALFGFGSRTGVDLPHEKEGVVPDPEWKRENFNGEEWRVGDTYHTAIGQYGFQISLVQALRAFGAIATNGFLLTPTIVKTDSVQPRDRNAQVPISPSYFKIMHEGMRQAVLEGTARALHTGAVDIAAKTGTAELGISKKRVNSWVIGFFPYETPRYAFGVLMESGPRANLYGSPLVMREVIDFLALERPQMLKARE